MNDKRFIVEAAAADRFAEACQANLAKAKMGDPMGRDTNIGPMARASRRDELHGRVERSVSAGAVVLMCGKPVDRPGFYDPATILDHVRPDHVAFCEETFGPVAAIIRLPNADEVIALANRTEFGLGAALWTADAARARPGVPNRHRHGVHQRHGGLGRPPAVRRHREIGRRA
nr:aldehyde dehydrogenase family protein [Rubellimicrobium arenae]